ncbi:MAG: RNA methyltransferase [Ignavibacteriae bacterium]|nr:RNA methyltransferase [Ignavibacteriota bacterium]
MSNVQYITSLDLPELQPYRTLRRPIEHAKQGIFVAEGEKVVRRLLVSKLTIVSMLMTKDWYDQILPINQLTTHQLTTNFPPFIFIAEKKLLETIVGYNLHQGVMAVAKVPIQRSLEETISTLNNPFLLVALDGLVSAENVGVVVRNSAGFGADAILVGETSSSPYLRRAVRNSMGAVFQLPVVHLSNLGEGLKTLKQTYHTRIIAADPKGEITLQEANLTGNICIIFGNEGEGISSEVLDVCTDCVAIPMLNDTDSLNVASASAVFLYEARKQKGLRFEV